MEISKLAAVLLALAALGVAAQSANDSGWKESQTPAPPAFDVKRLIPIEMPKYVSLKFGVDPQTLAITTDGIVRYVVVAISPTGSISAMYEGIRCSKGEVKTYARSSAGAKWSVLADPQWQSLDNLPSKHALALARQGLCEGRSVAAASLPELIRALTPSIQDRF